MASSSPSKSKPVQSVVTPGRLVIGGVAILTLGQAAAIGGVLAPGLFLPGVVLIGLGLVILAVAGVISVTAI